MRHRRILIVDDDKHILELYEALLSRAGYICRTASSLGQMREAVHSITLDGILLDLDLGHDQGLEGLPYLLKEAPYAPVVIVTADESVEQAVACLRQGAASYVKKSSASERLVEELEAVLTGRVESQESHELSGVGLIGHSAAIQETASMIERVKDVDSTVLILGESGTGKEVVARALHRMSQRHRAKFAAINCAAIPDTLLESELFGHRKGAFTDAKNDRVGVFEECTGGTLLLDEIGDMPLGLQAKLLRVLQERQVTPLGASRPVPIDVRILAATHRSMTGEIKEQRFRQDLFYRLSVVVIEIPPLRQRKEDVAELTEAFLREFNERFGKRVQMPDNQTMARMLAYDWPGNVRELRNAVERAVVLSKDNRLHFGDMLHHIGQELPVSEEVADSELIKSLSLPLNEAKRLYERTYLHNLLTQSNGNISEVSRVSGRYRADIYRLMERYGLSQENYRG